MVKFLRKIHIKSFVIQLFEKPYLTGDVQDIHILSIGILMAQYLITGYDFTDEGALQRRLSVRPHHIYMLKELKEKGNYIKGGAILDDEGKMVGTVMFMQFETEEELEVWRQSEPYLTQKVWETVDIKLFKVAEV